MAVFHLKYRPTNWKELDLVDVAEKIRKIISSDNPPQSYLFTGPKGAGKTSAARILAKSINCEHPEKGEPCNKCANCKEINSGASLDVVELDGASNRGIEDVRNLKDKAYLLPTKLGKKVLIIDEVHMLTREAFNALLKLLEEPPKHTIFILCTTEEGKIPETVMSRLVKIEFRKGTKEELKKSLKRIIEGEKMVLEEGVMEVLTDRSDGSFRNLQRMFNEMVVELGDNITNALAKNYFSKGSVEFGLEELEKFLTEKKTREIIKRWEKMAEVGFDFREYRERMVAYFQKKLVGYYEKKESSGLGLAELTKWLNLLIVAGKQEKEAVIGQLPLELALAEFLGEGVDDGGREKKIEKKSEKPKEEKEDEYSVSGESAADIDQINQDWGKLLVAVKPYNHSVEAFLRAARPIKISGKTLTMEVFYPFHKDKLEETKNQQIVEVGIKKVWGVELNYKCVLGKDKKPPLVINNETPMEKVTGEGNKDIYDVAKEIFG